MYKQGSSLLFHKILLRVIKNKVIPLYLLISAKSILM